MKYSIVIPCYNEGENVFELVEELSKYEKKYDVEFVLVENGSHDTTRQLLQKACEKKSNFKIAYVDNNQGYGFGLLNGLKIASGDYVGWLHADLQVSSKEMFSFIKFLEEKKDDKKYFLKGKRKNRRLYDCFFTAGMTLFELIVFQRYMYDIGAIPVLFHRELLNSFTNPPYDFSIELYTYYMAKRNKYVIKRKPVILEKRKKGVSSWDKGLSSKIKQSLRIMKDSIKIRKGEQVL